MRVRDARQTFLGVWLKAALTGGRIEVWGDGSQRRDLLYVDDAVRAFLLAAARDEANGEVFNVGAPTSVTLKELAELLVGLREGASYGLVPFPADRKAIDIGDYYTEGRKIRAALGWEAAVGLEDGLRRSIDYYAEHGEDYW
jgi:nucleoside-diphosphate-sugar epimerase